MTRYPSLKEGRDYRGSGNEPPIRTRTRNVLRGTRDYRDQFNSLPPETRRGFTWEQLVALPINVEKFPKAEGLRGGGEVFDVSSEGEVFIKDKGVGVRYGWDRDGKLIHSSYDSYRGKLVFFDQDGRPLDGEYLIAKYAYPPEIACAVENEGYKLFSVDVEDVPKDSFPDENAGWRWLTTLDASDKQVRQSERMKKAEAFNKREAEKIGSKGFFTTEASLLEGGIVVHEASGYLYYFETPDDSIDGGEQDMSVIRYI